MHIIKSVIVLLILISIFNNLGVSSSCETYLLNIKSPSAFIFNVKGFCVNVTLLVINNSCQRVVYSNILKNNSISGLLLMPGEYKILTKSQNPFYFHYYVEKLSCRRKALCPSFLIASNKSILIPIPDLESPQSLKVFLISNTSVTFEILQCNKIIKKFDNTTLVLSKCSYVYFKNPKDVFIKVCIYVDSLFYLSYKIIPCFVNPYLKISTPSPEGIASYGVINKSNIIKAYFIKTTSILGKFNITCILAYNSSQSLVPPCSASLQLNVVLSTGKQVYWLQNVLEFLTSKYEFKLADDILNISCCNARLSNDTITSPNGYVTVVNQSGRVEYYYGNYYCQPELKYRLPLCGYLVTNVTLEKCGILIKFALMLLKNGSSSVYKEIIYDIVLIHGNFSSAYLLVCGKHYTPVGSYYDAEFVFGGGGNGEITKFYKLNATLGLFYLENNTYVTFPNYFTFGEDTAEKAENVSVNFCKYYAKLTTGKENFSCHEMPTYSLDPFYCNSSSNSSTRSIITITPRQSGDYTFYYEIFILILLTSLIIYLILRKNGS